MAAIHVPAWQKLGLKLKNQPIPFPPVPASPANDFDAGSTPLKRKLPSEHEKDVDSPSATEKTRRKKVKTNGTHTPLINGATKSSPARELQNGDHRRKSVTFTADTKEEDGDSSKRLVRAAYASRLSRISGVKTEQIVAAEEELQALQPVDGHNSKTTHKVSSETEKNNNNQTEHGKQAEPKNNQAKKLSARPSAKVKTARQKKKKENMLGYLEEYKNSRTTWKFNKSRQTAVLRFALDLETLPEDYNESLQMYIKGLQGRSVRLKLRDQAEKVLAETVDSDRKLNERAQMVLEALGLEEEDEPEMEPMIKSSVTTLQPNGNHKRFVQEANEIKGSTGPKMQIVEQDRKKKPTRRSKAKKKKRRTASYSDSDDSSSSSSNDSD